MAGCSRALATLPEEVQLPAPTVGQLATTWGRSREDTPLVHRSEKSEGFFLLLLVVVVVSLEVSAGLQPAEISSHRM